MKNNNKAQYRVIAINTQTGDKSILKDVFESQSACQMFVEKMNAKHNKSAITFLTTIDTRQYDKKVIDRIFEKVVQF